MMKFQNPDRVGQLRAGNLNVRRAVCAALGGALLTLTAMNANAQTAPASTQSGTAFESNSAPLEEVVVTGTHIAHTGFTTPNPVSIVDSQQIQNLALTNVGDALAELPQNSTLYSPAAQGGSNFNTGATFANLRGLNPFFGTRTLTLVDGDRIVPTSIGGAVDLNIIPSILVQRLETVTGGASAAYGSDAVAGVVNIIVDNKLDGFKSQADYGSTKYGDGDDTHFSAAFGTGFAGGLGHFVIGAEYETIDSIGSCSQVRSWCAGNYAEFSNPAYAATGGPQYIIGPNGKATGATLAGVLYAPAFPGAPFAGPALGQFNNGGTALAPFDPGLYGGPLSQTPREGGDGTGVGVSDTTQLLPGVKHYSLLTHETFDITDSLQAYTEAGFARRDSGTYQGESGAQGTFIAPNNAFLSPAVAAEIPAGGYLYSSGNDLPDQINTTRDTTWHVALGLKGNLIAGWTWDGHLQYGHHETDTVVNNNQASSNFAAATNAVLTNPALPYNAVSNPAVCAAPAPAGCAPLDLFGTNPSAVNPQQAQAFAFAYGPLIDDLTNSLKVAALNARGDIFQGWGAGPIQGAVGGEYRRADVSDTHDLAQYASLYYQQFANYGDPFTAKTEVEEGYAEVNVPVLKDLPLVNSLNLDAAIRETHNATTGIIDHTYSLGGISDTSNDVTFNTWKLSAVWDTTDWLRLRATQSRDTRAPSFEELFTVHVFPAGFPFFPTTNPNQGVGGSTYFPSSIINGNPKLNPETADTTTAGFVVSPSGWATGLQLSVDWYQIKLHDAIAELPSGAVGPLQAVVDNCIATGTHCDQINNGTFTPTSTAALTSVNDVNLNLGVYTTRGVDAEVGYHLPLMQVLPSAPGELDFRVITSYVYDMIIDTGGGAPPINYAGQSGPAGGFSGSYNASPKLQSNTFLTYTVGDFTGTLQWRYVGSGRYLTSDGFNLITTCGAEAPAMCPAGSINNNHVESASYFNLAATYKVTKAVQLFARIDNVLNKSPPVDPSAGSATNPALFDTLGATYKVGVRLQY
jgi:outer membrane receptor protein involved in Fe transport